MAEKKGFFEGDGRLLFALGLVGGIALMAVFGNGISLPRANGGSQVVREFNNGGTQDTTGTTATGELAPVTADEHIRGDINKAKVVIVEYSDFQCPFCQRHHPTMQQIMQDYGDQVAWVYRHFPLQSIHPQATPSAIAAECAAEQGKFWEFGDKLFDNQALLSDSYYAQLAGELKLNMNQFNNCYSSQKYASKVTEQMNSGVDAGVQGTPATFVNGVMVSGAVPYESIADLIDQMIAS